LIINYNKQAILEMHCENFETSKTLLKKAQDLLKFSSSTSTVLLKSMTLNNQASLFSKLKDIESAIILLTEAEKSSSMTSKTNQAVTLINLGSLKSPINPQESLHHFQKALNLLKAAPNLTKNVLTSLIICLHNASQVHQTLGQKIESESHMRESWELSLQHFGPDHYLTQTVFQDLSDLKSGSFAHVKILKNAEIQKPVMKEDKKLIKILGRKSRQMSVEASELQNIRFLTGERLQPMHKTKFFRKNRSRPTSRATHTASKVLKQKILDNMRSDSNQLEGLGRIEAYIENLQEKVDNFQEKCLPLKELAEDSQELLSSKTSVNDARFKNARIMEEIRNKAACDIQRAVRGWRGRQDVRRVKEKEGRDKEAAKEIVAAFKGFLGRVVVRKKWEELQAIQETDEEKEQDCRKSEEEAAVLIQARVRGFLQRRRYQKMRRSAIKIQSVVRMWLVKIIYKDIRKAVVMIQQEYRQYFNRKKAKV
jgi:tetratricopeptide (TPR) repeat protein